MVKMEWCVLDLQGGIGQKNDLVVFKNDIFIQKHSLYLYNKFIDYLLQVLL